MSTETKRKEPPDTDVSEFEFVKGDVIQNVNTGGVFRVANLYYPEYGDTPVYKLEPVDAETDDNIFVKCGNVERNSIKVKD